MPGTEVVGLIEEGTKVVGVRVVGGKEMRADLVVVAAGAW
jgi:glycine/D-amino acid oxidase-like deaminating enzyme